MLLDRPLTFATLFRVFWLRIGTTWGLTLVETTLIALIPLLIGFAIDGLADRAFQPLWHLCALLVGLVAVAVLRRVFDTRAYGTIRVQLGHALAERNPEMPVSALNARVLMARELADFLEEGVPLILTAVVRLVVAIVVLFAYHWILAGLALVAGVAMVLLYGLFHRRFFRLNRAINTQSERQVKILDLRNGPAFLRHLTSLRKWEVRLSDTEALVYGVIYLILLALVVANLSFTALVLVASAGTIFAIVTYSWEFVDGAIQLPIALQTWSRLSEIIGRINKPS